LLLDAAGVTQLESSTTTPLSSTQRADTSSSGWAIA